jgi:hypothetical protein
MVESEEWKCGWNLSRRCAHVGFRATSGKRGRVRGRQQRGAERRCCWEAMGAHVRCRTQLGAVWGHPQPDVDHIDLSPLAKRAVGPRPSSDQLFDSSINSIKFRSVFSVTNFDIPRPRISTGPKSKAGSRLDIEDLTDQCPCVSGWTCHPLHHAIAAREAWRKQTACQNGTNRIHAPSPSWLLQGMMQ